MSSRSHAIFTLTIEVRAKRDTKAMTVSKFHMMDLAGRDIIVPRVNRSGHPCGNNVREYSLRVGNMMRFEYICIRERVQVCNHHYQVKHGTVIIKTLVWEYCSTCLGCRVD